MLTREEQRARETRQHMLAFQLWCHLQNLITEIKAGDTTKLCEFQQFVQYAPDKMKIQLLETLECQ